MRSGCSYPDRDSTAPTPTPILTTGGNPFTTAIEYAILGVAKDYTATGVAYAKLQDAFAIWGNIEPEPGKYFWGPLDALMLEYQSAGFTRLQVDIAALSPWASSKPPQLGNQGDTFPKEEYLVGQPVVNIFRDEDRPAVRHQLKECFQNPGRIFEWELRKVHKNGHTLWVRETARVMQEKDSPVMLIACQNITKRKQAENELRRKNRALATISGSNQALIRAQEEQALLNEEGQHYFDNIVQASEWDS